MAEFPGLGKHCEYEHCNMLDFLPMKCDACSKIMCSKHIMYDAHECTSSFRKNVQVPVCPLCNKPVPTKKDESPDITVGAHIDRDCQSDPRKKVYNNRCSLKTCKQKELVPMLCKDCKRNFCVKHRFGEDHDCTKSPHKENSKLRPLSTLPGSQTSESSRKSKPDTSNDEELARQLQNMMSGANKLTREEIDKRLAEQLQREEYNRAGIVNERDRSNNDRCTIN